MYSIQVYHSIYFYATKHRSIVSEISSHFLILGLRHGDKFLLDQFNSNLAAREP